MLPGAAQDPLDPTSVSKWLRADSHSSESAPHVNAFARVLDHGTVKGRVLFPPNFAKPIGPGELMITVRSAWGEPLKTMKFSVPGQEFNDHRNLMINGLTSSITFPRFRVSF